MAAPHVAGAVTRYLGVRPSAAPSEVSAALVSSASVGTVRDPAGSTNRRLQTPRNDLPPRGSLRIPPL
ncbi:hypothetical protein [Streptomyces sp. NPDC016734]|uniref:hypothetical protein n=1 Tax=Streptomyces TaxID=1883 RepID=UPI003799391F